MFQNIVFYRLFIFTIPLILLGACAPNPGAWAVQQITYEQLEKLTHAETHFTQGLLFHEGVLFEGTGEYGSSRLVRYRQDHQTPGISRPLPARYFGEGIAIYEDRLYQLTWRENEALIYSPTNLARLGSFNYQGDGWGLTADARGLWMSNGSSELRQIDTEGNIQATLQVTYNGAPLDRLNELEWVEGYFLANRWYDNQIYFIEDQSGEVEAVLDLSALAQPHQADRNHVLNGVAWHAERRTLWITGKNWDSLYELKLLNWQPAAD